MIINCVLLLGVEKIYLIPTIKCRGKYLINAWYFEKLNSGNSNVLESWFIIHVAVSSTDPFKIVS